MNIFMACYVVKHRDCENINPFTITEEKHTSLCACQCSPNVTIQTYVQYFIFNCSTSQNKRSGSWHSI